MTRHFSHMILFIPSSRFWISLIVFNHNWYINPRGPRTAIIKERENLLQLVRCNGFQSQTVYQCWRKCTCKQIICECLLTSYKRNRFLYLVWFPVIPKGNYFYPIQARLLIPFKRPRVGGLGTPLWSQEPLKASPMTVTVLLKAYQNTKINFQKYDLWRAMTSLL